MAIVLFIFMKHITHYLLILSIITTMFSCRENTPEGNNAPLSKNEETPRSLEEEPVSIETEQAVPEEADKQVFRQLPDDPGIKSLPLLSSEAKKMILQKEGLVADEAWNAAKEHCPEGFVFVQGDRFTRTGRPENEHYYPEETIDSFYMGTQVISQEEYQLVMGTNPSQNIGDDLPVEYVNWYNALEYCNKRSIQEGLTPYYYVYIYNDERHEKDLILIEDSQWNQVRGKDYLSFTSNDEQATGYRLPTIEEWEYAHIAGFLNDKEDSGPFEEPMSVSADTQEITAEWTYTKKGYFDEICVRGRSWLENPDKNDTSSFDANYQRNDLGFRVVRNLSPRDKRIPGIVISDSLNVRDKSGLSGNKVGSLNSLTPIMVYETAGSGEWIDGTLDFWLKISDDDKWINANYTALLPFFSRVTGRINKLSELKYDITDCMDLREPGFQFYRINPVEQTICLRGESSRSDIPFYGLPVLLEEPVNEDWFFSTGFDSREYQNWKVYSRYDNDLLDDSLIRYPGAKLTFNKDNTLEVDSNSLNGEDPSVRYTWSLSDNNSLILNSGEHTISVYFTDSRHMVLKEQRGKGLSISWLSSEAVLESPELYGEISQKDLNDAGFYDRSLMMRYLAEFYDSSSERRDMWDKIEYLIERGASVNTADRSGNTALHIAADCWDVGAVKALLEAGADPYYRNISDSLPIDLISSHHRSDAAGTENQVFSLLWEFRNH